MPKYELFWKTTIAELSYRAAVETAANGATGHVALGGIRKCSPQKKNWYCIVRVRHGGIVRASKGDLAAPAASLGRVLVDDGMLAAWPTIVFRFTVDKAGKSLTVRSEEGTMRSADALGPVSGVGSKARHRESYSGTAPSSERAERPVASAGMADCLDQLRRGVPYAFRNWPDTKGSVPETTGVYTIWADSGQFLYVGRSDNLRNRLNSHWLGNRANDQFNVYIADRILLRTLTPEQIWQIGAGELRFDGLIRDYIRTNLDFRFCQTIDAKAVEERIRDGRWPYRKTPTLNPL